MTNHVLTDSHGHPLNIITTSASMDERKQVLPLLDTIKHSIHNNNLSKGIPILEADKGYDSMALRKNILKYDVFPWIPYRKMGKKNKNGISSIEKMRWKVERSISWLQRKYRRIVARYERRIKYWKAFLKMSLIYFWMNKIINFGDLI